MKRNLNLIKRELKKGDVKLKDYLQFRKITVEELQEKEGNLPLIRVYCKIFHQKLDDFMIKNNIQDKEEAILSWLYSGEEFEFYRNKRRKENE